MLYKSIIEPLFRYMYVIHILYDVEVFVLMQYYCVYTFPEFLYNTFTHHLYHKNTCITVHGQYFHKQQPTQQGPASQISGQETTLY